MSFKYLTAPLGVFLILYFAYTMLGVMLFGEVIFNWQNPIHGFYTLFRFILGDFRQGSTDQDDTGWCISAGIDPKISYADMEIGNKEYCHLFFLRYHMVTQKT